MRVEALALVCAPGLVSCAARAPLDFDLASRARIFRRDAITEIAPPPAEPAPLRVVMIAIDGVRWQDVFRGPDDAMLVHEGSTRFLGMIGSELTPHIHALADRGVALGDQDQYSAFDATGPNFVSLPGYSEMLTGRVAECDANDCDARPDETIADVFRALPGVRDEDVVVISSWERIAQIAAHDQMRIVVSCGRNHGDTRFAMADDPMTAGLQSVGPQTSARPGGGDYRPDALTGPLAVEYFARKRPRFMFLSLGDTDEHGHAGKYWEYLAALQRADAIVGELVRITTTSSDIDPSRVVFVVTADHGRGSDFCDHGKFCPESRGTWLVAAGGDIPHRGSLSWTPPRFLRDVAPTIRALIGAPLETREDAGVPILELLR